jgi:hypothetical protein
VIARTLAEIGEILLTRRFWRSGRSHIHIPLLAQDCPATEDEQRSGRSLYLDNNTPKSYCLPRARYPSGKGEVCKTFIRQFDSDPRLHISLKTQQFTSASFTGASVLEPYSEYVVEDLVEVFCCMNLGSSMADCCPLLGAALWEHLRHLVNPLTWKKSGRSSHRQYLKQS